MSWLKKFKLIASECFNFSFTFVEGVRLNKHKNQKLSIAENFRSLF